MNPNAKPFGERISENQPNAREGVPPPRVPDHELLRVIGSGAYGAVWLARNTTTGVFRAVKVVRRSAFSDQRPYEREFRGIQEFEPVSRAHEGLVDVLHVGQNEVEGYFYYVMELADDAAGEVGKTNSQVEVQMRGPNRTAAGGSGPQPPPGDRQPTVALTYRPKTLATEVVRHGRLPLEECLRVGSAVASALEHLHKNGLVHRDVKPSNIVFVGGLPKLADIGLVAQVDEARSQVGTPEYMPLHGAGKPEGDLYALGKVLYVASTGKAVREFPELPTDVTRRPEQTALGELNLVVLKACEDDPKMRHHTAAELRAELELARINRLSRIRRNERYVTVVKRAGVGALALAVAGVMVFRAQLKAQEQRVQRTRRDSLMQQALLGRLRTHQEGWSSNSLSRLREVVGSAPEAPQIRDLRDQAAATFFGLDADRTGYLTNQDVWQVALDPSGEHMLLAGRSNLVEWTWRGSNVSRLPVPGALNVTYRPDGTPLALAARERTTLALVNAHTGATLCLLPLSGPVQAIADLARLPTAFSPDASLVGATLPMEGGAPLLSVWRTDTGNLVRQRQLETTALGFSPDSTLLARGLPDGRVQVLDLATLEAVAEFVTDRTAVLSVALQRSPFRHDLLNPGPSFLLAAGTSGAGVFIWDLATRALLDRCLGPANEVSCLAFNSDGSLLLGGGREFVRFWETAAGRQLFEVEATGFIHALALSLDDSKLAVVGNSMQDTDIALSFGIDYGRSTRTLLGLSTPVIQVKISPNGERVAALAADWKIGVWQWPSGRLLHVLEGPIGTSPDNAALAFSADGTHLAASAGQRAELWNLTNAQKEREWPVPPGLVEVMSFDDAGRLCLFRLENADAHSPVHSLAGGKVLNNVCCFRELSRPDWQTPVAKFSGFSSSLYVAKGVDHGRLVAVEGDSVEQSGTNRMLNLFEMATGREVRSWRLDKSGVAASFATDPNGELLGYSPSDAAYMQVLELPSFNSVTTLPYYAFALAPASEVFFAGGNITYNEMAQLKVESEGLTLFGRHPWKPLCSFEIEERPIWHNTTFAPKGDWVFWAAPTAPCAPATSPGSASVWLAAAWGGEAGQNLDRRLPIAPRCSSDH